MNNYRAIFDGIRKENKDKAIDFKQYEKELENIISEFEDIIKKYPGSVSSVQSLQEVISCYRLLQDQQSANQIVIDLLADKNYGDVFSNIKLLSIPLLIDEQDYDGALSLCDEVISAIPNSSEAAFLLYNKGKIFEALKNDTTNAKNMYNQLIEQYPNSVYAYLVAESLGKEVIHQKQANVKEVKTFDLSIHPNPFNPTTTINYQLPAAGHVEIKVFDMLGRHVATLVNGMKDPGSYSATFDGSRFSSGVYFVRITAMPQDGFVPLTKTMKMLMMK